MYFSKTPDIVKPLASDFLWSFPRDAKDIYLTFDDGPTPQITGEILNTLDKFHAKATFFCIGGNAAANPEAFEEIQRRGHSVGNHTWNHMNGWEYSDFSYLRNVLECSSVVASNLFRPPYGRIKRSQARSLKKRFTLVMWDVLSGDWDRTISREKCLKNVTSNAREGSIIVLHDSEKAYKNMSYTLPRILEYLIEKGYQFKSIRQTPAARSAFSNSLLG
ncbi:MAG: polysaccharide deacetylase family protein [Cryomorphaceae bacterium]|nr:polysaccharide deacetylase family protein [Flavobacteriales bacterium]